MALSQKIRKASDAFSVSRVFGAWIRAGINVTGCPNLLVQVNSNSSALSLYSAVDGVRVREKRKAPPSVCEPPRAFQYLSARGLTRSSSEARERMQAFIAWRSLAIKPICTFSPDNCERLLGVFSNKANTCGLSMEVSVM